MKVPHPSSPTIVGEIAVRDGALYGLHAGNEVFLSGNSPTYTEADAGYLSADNIPVTRVGDNTYLPVDIKGDFKGAIQPYGEHPYFLVENDQTIVALRPGFNGEFQRVFYAFSYNGITVNDLRMTDSEYRPSWLRTDEYVRSVIDGNANGFLIEIASTTDLSVYRAYWVDHNGTLDSKFHTFLDVTTTIQAYPSGMRTIQDFGSATYIPETNMFVCLSQTATNKLMLTWYTVDRAFQTVRSDTIAAILPTKTVDWADLSGVFTGTSNQHVVMDATTEANLANYYKFINEPSARLMTRLLDGLQTSNRVRLSYAYDAGVVRVFIPLLAYLQFTGTDYRWGWTISMDYTVSTNKIRHNPVTDAPLTFQTLPYVVDASKTTISTATVVPTPMTDDFKANKFPMNVGTAPYNISSASFRTEVVGDQVVTSQVWSANSSVFSVMSSPLSVYTGATTAAKKMDLYRRPYFNGQKAAYASYAAYDASILSKQLNGFSFVSNLALTGKSQSRLYGESALTTKTLVATLPNLTVGTAYSVDSNSFKPALGSPSSVIVAAGYNTRYAPITFINGNNAMITSQCSYNLISSTSGTWLAYNVDPVTGAAETTYSIVPGTTSTMLDAVDALTIAQSTYVPTGGVTYSNRSIQPYYVDVAGGNVYALYTLCFGNQAEAFQYEYAILKLPLNGNVIGWPATAAAAVISRQTGAKRTGNLRLTGYVADRESLGVYRHTDGTMYLLTNTAVYYTTVGGSANEIRAMRLTNQQLFNGGVSIGSHSISAAGAAGIHPQYGLYYSSAANDFRAKVSLFYKDKTSITTSQADRLFASCDAWIAGGVTSSTLFVLSSKSAAGFVLYSSEIQVFMYGKSSIVPTQTIVLSDITPSPANKTFNFYVQWNGIGFVLTPTLSSIPESPTSTYVGSVVTNATGIVSNTIRKVTRIDTYRLFDTAPIIGSAIRAYQKQPSIQAYVFDTTAEVNQFKSTHVPPAQSAVFNTWDRTNGNEYFPGGVGATGDAAAWSFQTNPDRIVQANNTAAVCGFISPDTYTDYDLEAVLFSSNADDDGIGLSVAFARSGTTNLDLSIMRTCNGLIQTQTGTPARNWNFGFYFTGPSIATAERSNLAFKQIGLQRQNSVDTPNGWTGVYTKVKVVRRGDIITAYTSDFSTTLEGVGEVLEASEISIDLTKVAVFAPLTTAAKYGFTTISQAASTFYNVKFSGGLDSSRVIDLQTNTVWKYSFVNSEWAPVAIAPKDELGYVRYVTNPDTGETYFVTQDTVIKQ